MSHALHLSTPLIICAVLLDAALGDPSWLPHPARMIGAAISRGEKMLHTGTATLDLRKGAILVTSVVGLSAIVTWAIIDAGDRISPVLGALAAIVIAWTTLAARGLDDAAREVQESLLHGDEARARRAMPALVGRDPASLDREGMIRATVESVAENSSDGVVAPLMFLFIAGPVGAIAYKAINTLDSMIGYRDERYIRFGRVAARLDDAANWIPARLTALCIAAASELWLRRGRNAIATCRRDARHHESPNAGYAEAAMAGALGVELGGSATYAGETIERATLGIAECPTTIDDIATARMSFKIAVLIAFVTLAVLRAIL
ncbi:MAG: adenosylcobinamide-phosphate synthase CbiB [Candidatus Binataceae bacterium]